MSKTNISPEQMEMIDIALKQRFATGLDKPKKLTMEDKKILSILRISGEDADLNSPQADSLRAYLGTRLKEFKPSSIKGDIKKSKKDEEPTDQLDAFEKLEDKFDKRWEAVESYLSQSSPLNKESTEEDKKAWQGEVDKKIAKDMRMRVLYKNLTLSIDKLKDLGILDDYIKERTSQKRPFTPDIQAYLTDKNYIQSPEQPIQKNNNQSDTKPQVTKKKPKGRRAWIYDRKQELLNYYNNNKDKLPIDPNTGKPYGNIYGVADKQANQEWKDQNPQ